MVILVINLKESLESILFPDQFKKIVKRYKRFDIKCILSLI